MRRGVTTRRQRPRRAPGRGRPCGALAKPVFRWGAGSLATENRKREGGAAWRFREPGLASEACVGNQGKVDACSTKALLEIALMGASLAVLGRKWQPIPAFLPIEFHGQRSLACCSPWGLKSKTRLSD